jgi:hypothetical protein
MLAVIKKIKKSNEDWLKKDASTFASETNEDVSRIPPPISTNCLLGRVQLEIETLLTVYLEKADYSGKWHKRRAFLTKTSLILIRPEDDYIREEINLCHIKNIERQQGKVIGSETAPDQKSSSNTDLKSSKDALGSMMDDLWHFQFFARVDELNCEIKYSFRLSSKTDMNCLIRSIQKEQANCAQDTDTAICSMRRRVRVFHDRYSAFGVMAGLLVANFVLDIVQSELQPETNSEEAAIFRAVDTIFTLLFAMDLAINIVSHSPCAFIRKGWNIIDLIIISLSLASISSPDGSNVNSLRTIRAFRAVRLVSSIPKLREIVDALLHSVQSLCARRPPYARTVTPSYFQSRIRRSRPYRKASQERHDEVSHLSRLHISCRVF